MQRVSPRKRFSTVLPVVTLLAMMLLQLFAASQAWAENTPPATAAPATPVTDQKGQSTPNVSAQANLPVIESVSVDGVKNETPHPQETKIALHKTIRIKIRNFDALIKTGNGNITPDKLLLYIDGIPFKNQADKVDDVLIFDLRSDNSNIESWRKLLGRKDDHNLYERTVPLTVGVENGNQATPMQVTLVRMEEMKFKLFGTLVIVSAILFLVLAMRSDLLRDCGDQPTASARKTFSLARTQMALWFLVVTAGYIFIWIVTNDMGSLTEGVVGLMGISAATALGSAAVDSSKDTAKITQLNEQKAKKLAGEVDVEKLVRETALLSLSNTASPSQESKDAIATKEAALAAKRTEVEQIDSIIRDLEKAVAPKVTKGFIRDLFNDDGGISLHRLQIAVWTVVLIVIFVSTVIETLTMPQFGAIQLALMGISGGTYLGFKLPEKQG